MHTRTYNFVKQRFCAHKQAALCRMHPFLHQMVAEIGCFVNCVSLSAGTLCTMPVSRFLCVNLRPLPHPLPYSCEKVGRGTAPIRNCAVPFPIRFHALLFSLLLISAIAVWAAGGECIFTHEFRCAARFAHGIVKMTQRGGKIIQPKLFH